MISVSDSLRLKMEAILGRELYGESWRQKGVREFQPYFSFNASLGTAISDS